MQLEITVLGRSAAKVDGRPVSLGGTKQRAVLAFLSLRSNKAVSIDDLCNAVWGADVSAGRSRTLQVYVANLRAVLDPERTDRRLVRDPAGYRLRADADELDLLRFHALVARASAHAQAGRVDEAAETLRGAEALWGDCPLADLADATIARPEIEALQESRLAAIEDRLDLDLSLARHAAVLSELTALVRAHPLRERLRAQHILALYRAGQQGAALASYRELRGLLTEELGVDPTPTLQRLVQAVLRQDPQLNPPRPPERRTTGHLNNVPISPNPLIGRDADVAHIQRSLVDGEQRLITLHGSGGVGKTRLALAAAAQAADLRNDGACVVELAAVAMADLVLPTVAQALGVQPGPDHPDLLMALQHALGTTDLLLIIDNFEHLLDAAATVSRLVWSVPGLTVLVTSRSVLNVTGEHVIRVHPLAVTAALELFWDRARAASADLRNPDFDDLARQICRRLDCLPLAIELAAVRLRILAPEDLLRRLNGRLDLLIGGARDLPARQRTLRATIEWSVDLLRPDERRLLAQMSVFANPFRLDAAQAVSDLGDRTLDCLEALWQHSLLTERHDPRTGERRFLLLETVHEYAADLLTAQDLDAARSRHADHVQSIVLQADAGAFVSTSRSWLDRLRAEQDDIRAALEWSIQTPQRQATALRLISVLWRFWEMAGAVPEGNDWCSRVLAVSNDEDPALVGRGMNAACCMAW